MQHPQCLSVIVEAMVDKKAFDIVCLDVRRFSPLTDYIILASGHVDQHLRALSREVQEQLRCSCGEKVVYSEGIESGEWIILDYIRWMVHIVLPRTREYYQLDSLWASGVRLDLHSGVLI